MNTRFRLLMTVRHGTTSDEAMTTVDGQQLSCAEVEDYSNMQYRGIVEGFYGKVYTVEDILSLFDYMEENKMNTFVYGPKGDPYHLGNWRDEYPTEITEEERFYGQMTQDDMRTIAAKAAENNISFVWSIHPAMQNGIDFTNRESVEKGIEDIIVKFDHLYDLGIRQFGVFVDDINLACEMIETLEFSEDYKLQNLFEEIQPWVYRLRDMAKIINYSLEAIHGDETNKFTNLMSAINLYNGIDTAEIYKTEFVWLYSQAVNTNAKNIITVNGVGETKLNDMDMRTFVNPTGEGEIVYNVYESAKVNSLRIYNAAGQWDGVSVYAVTEDGETELAVVEDKSNVNTHVYDVSALKGVKSFRIAFTDGIYLNEIETESDRFVALNTYEAEKKVDTAKVLSENTAMYTEDSLKVLKEKIAAVEALLADMAEAVNNLEAVERAFEMGDVNHSGIVDIDDATLIQMHLAKALGNTAFYKENADYSKDGKITIYEATLIQLMLAS